MSNFRISPYFCKKRPHGKYKEEYNNLVDRIFFKYCPFRILYCRSLGIPYFDNAICLYLFCEGDGHYLIQEYTLMKRALSGLFSFNEYQCLLHFDCYILGISQSRLPCWHFQETFFDFFGDWFHPTP